MIGLHRVLSLALVLLATACQSPPDDLREWTPGDHKNTTNQASMNRQSSGTPRSSVAGLDEVTISTWASKCATCHGKIGRGDGPQSAMFRARDLSDPVWQGSVSDAQIAQVIQQGRGQMPAFALPQATLDSLVRLVRLFNRARAEGP